ncbi:DDB1- and CUL4-associated factor 6-like isoform X2 [Homalodisca vitripennis]|uniref:DDB1- and CUL4-associated factor 6-like isoform X2 n=1 Tax=Homalodisca vitripennis TaxID=197043 RepID=UPI001EEAFACB|nr:DDB1- and CUL4-associated factor 6-like isoform X2 [Homalodisca vitripennis]
MKPSRKYKNSIFRHIYEQPYNDRTRLKLYSSAKGNLDFIQRLSLQRSLPVHSGCVNCICWSDTGEFLLSGSDDQHLVISHAYNYKTLTNYKTSHRANIFSAKFLPCSSDRNIVSCSGDGIILFTDLMRPSETRHNQFNCHKGTTYEIATVPNEPHTFLSCGEDYTVRCYDLRIKERCTKDNCDDDVLVFCQRAVTAVSINNVRPYQMAVGCSDSTVRIFDRRMIGTKSSGFLTSGRRPRPFVAFTPPLMEDRSYRITSLAFSPQGEDVLVSYSSEQLYMFSIKDETTVEYEPEVMESDEAMEEEMAKPSSGLPPVRRLRLRGDWSDTGPDARPERDVGQSTDAAQARPTLHATLMQRMTDVLSRMLNDPATRAALSHGGEDDHNEYAEENSRDRPEDASNARNPEYPEAEAPVVAVSIEEIYSDSSSQLETPSADVVTGSSQVRWSPPIASPTPTPAEDTVMLPSFESSFVAVKPSPPSDSQPSTSTPASTSTSTPASSSTSAPNSSSSGDNLNTITDQLSTMRHGFIERHGTEPVVNLMYSDKGSTASRISLSVADEVNRETVPQPQEEAAGPSSPDDRLCTSANSSLQVNQGSPLAAPMSDDDEDFVMDSDDNMDSSRSPPPHPPPSQQQQASPRRDNRSDLRKRPGVHRSMEEELRFLRSVTCMDDRVKVRKPAVKQKYTGHRNARTMIKEATFWGEEFVLSGSDCGHVFIWERETARLVMLLQADHHVVNCLQPHPFLPVLATSGIDYDIKLWAPLQPEPSFNQEMAEELVKRNEVMLEETKDTITVPASFMIRMLACLNQIRRGGRSRMRHSDGGPDQPID